MVKTIAERHGLRATFMPKPFAHLTGNGAHIHLSLWDAKGKTNRFHDEADELGLSGTAYHFLGGVLAHAEGMAALTNPTVNSYKRINAPITASGATWAPNTVTWSGNNRTHMVRVPDPRRFEFRLADGATNPYLAPAAYLAAGLDGIARGTKPPKRLDIDMYALGHKLRNAPRLPLNLLDALRAFEKNKVLQQALGAPFAIAYGKLRWREWPAYTSQLTDWERAYTLDV